MAAYWRYTARWALFAVVLNLGAHASAALSPGSDGIYPFFVVGCANIGMVIGLCLQGVLGHPPRRAMVAMWSNIWVRQTLGDIRDRLADACRRSPRDLHYSLWRRSHAVLASARRIDAQLRRKEGR